MSKKNQLDPTVFAQKYQIVAHQYLTRFSKHCLYEPNRKFN